MSKSILHLSFIFLSFTFISCSKEDSLILPPNPQSVLVPLAIGNRWTYRVTWYDTTGHINLSDTLTFYIRGDTTVSGIHWYLQGYEGTMVGQLGFRNDAVGYHITNFGAYYTYRYPAAVGETYDGRTIESTDSLINTPIDTFSCYVYRSSWYGKPYREIYAPGIGLVHDEILWVSYEGQTSYLVQTHDLISISIKH